MLPFFFVARASPANELPSQTERATCAVSAQVRTERHDHGCYHRDVTRSYGKRRLEKWDYSSPAFYFVTFCTHERKCLLSHITKGAGATSVKLSSLGQHCVDAATGLPERFPSIILDSFVIMPNHVHALVNLTDHSVSLGKVIGVWTASVTSRARKEGFQGSLWQSRYHDHIVCSEKDLKRLRLYIQNNPEKWLMDRFFDPSSVIS